MRAPARRLTLPAVVLAVLVLDRLTKIWAREWLFPRSPVELASFLHLTYVENTGAAFGIGQGSNVFFIVVSILLLAGLRHFWLKVPESDVPSRIALALVAGGAVGNLIDRLAYRAVVDFIDFRVWPVFNVADSCITIGALILALRLGRQPEQGAA